MQAKQSSRRRYSPSSSAAIWSSTVELSVLGLFRSSEGRILRAWQRKGRNRFARGRSAMRSGSDAFFLAPLFLGAAAVAPAFVGAVELGLWEWRGMKSPKGRRNEANRS